MPVSSVVLEIENKDDAKQLIGAFLNHPPTKKIEITKVDPGYEGVFTTEDAPTPGAIA